MLDCTFNVKAVIFGWFIQFLLIVDFLEEMLEEHGKRFFFSKETCASFGELLFVSD